MLTVAEIDQYHREGYVIPTGFRPDDATLDALRMAIRYMPATSGLYRDDDMPLSKFYWSTLPIKLLEGENQNPVNDFLIGHDARPW